MHSIIQKHIKRQIISLEGGFQVIADLNAYHAFTVTLKVPQITNDFSNLKMLGHVFIVSDAKDLAQIVRDVTRYGGSFRPEVCWFFPSFPSLFFSFSFSFFFPPGALADAFFLVIFLLGYL